MIVKIRTIDEGWIYYECKNVKVRKLTDIQYENSKSLRNGERFEIDESGRTSTKPHMMSIEQKTEYVWICLNTMAYLLNDNGKTIEKLI